MPEVPVEGLPRLPAAYLGVGDKGRRGHYCGAVSPGHIYEASREEYLISRGRRAVAWDEILEGGEDTDAVVMSWRGEAGGRKAALLGRDAVMVPEEYMYFDYMQGLDEDEPGASRLLPIKKKYTVTNLSRKGWTTMRRTIFLVCRPTSGLSGSLMPLPLNICCFRGLMP